MAALAAAAGGLALVPTLTVAADLEAVLRRRPLRWLRPRFPFRRCCCPWVAHLRTVPFLPPVIIVPALLLHAAPCPLPTSCRRRDTTLLVTPPPPVVLFLVVTILLPMLLQPRARMRAAPCPLPPCRRRDTTLLVVVTPPPPPVVLAGITLLPAMGMDRLPPDLAPATTARRRTTGAVATARPLLRGIPATPGVVLRRGIPVTPATDHRGGTTRRIRRRCRCTRSSSSGVAPPVRVVSKCRVKGGSPRTDRRATAARTVAAVEEAKLTAKVITRPRVTVKARAMAMTMVMTMVMAMAMATPEAPR